MALKGRYDPKTMPIQAMLAEVADDVDLKSLLMRWAEDYPAEFLKILLACTPQQLSVGAAPVKNVLQIHPALQRTTIDAK